MREQCEHCGHIKLGKQEKQIIGCLPGTTLDISEKTKLKTLNVNAYLFKMKHLGIIKSEKQPDGRNYWSVS